MDCPLDIAMVWHMHQPYYKDLLTGEYLLPWVRLHATKDYYDMVAILDRFPTIRQTFNLVPSLLVQIEEYGSGKGIDIFLNLSLKPATDLSEEEKNFILCNFFLASWENMIKPFPRYWELLQKRGLHCTRERINEAVRFYSVQDYLDLQFLFNLCWFDPLLLQSDPFLLSMIKKGRGYGEEEKLKLLEKQKEITARVIPKYRKMMEEGRVELTTTPFYHPILPLLCNTDIASESMPDIKLPATSFRHPEDAAVQIERAVTYHQETFGARPAGMWPSEGSVSEEALGIIASKGIKWVATDEEILEASGGVCIKRGDGGVPSNADFLYKPYLYKAGTRDIAMVFRDHQLSDLIGFVYSSWEPGRAADDFVDRLHKIRKALGKKNRQGGHLVSVILDGENCWEHYRNDGLDFLTRLYTLIESDPLLNMVTVSEHLSAHPPKERLERIWPGSWIHRNFKIWIGHEEDNLAWDCLKMTRDDLAMAEREGRIVENLAKKAWEHIYIAEGSDWCWWYGDDHSTENDEDFDKLFRKNLINVYQLIKKDPPDKLLSPIIREKKGIPPTVDAVSYITPTIDGEISSYFEWLGSAVVELTKQAGAMHKAEDILSFIYYGFDKNNLYIRLDLTHGIEPEEIMSLKFSIHFTEPRSFKIDAKVSEMQTKEYQEIDGYRIKTAFKDILEAEIPFDLLGADTDAEIKYAVSVLSDGGEIERWPATGYLSIKMPGPDFESTIWNAYA